MWSPRPFLSDGAYRAISRFPSHRQSESSTSALCKANMHPSWSARTVLRSSQCGESLLCAPLCVTKTGTQNITCTICVTNLGPNRCVRGKDDERLEHDVCHVLSDRNDTCMVGTLNAKLDVVQKAPKKQHVQRRAPMLSSMNDASWKGKRLWARRWQGRSVVTRWGADDCYFVGSSPNCIDR